MSFLTKEGPTFRRVLDLDYFVAWGLSAQRSATPVPVLQFTDKKVKQDKLQPTTSPRLDCGRAEVLLGTLASCTVVDTEKELIEGWMTKEVEGWMEEWTDG